MVYESLLQQTVMMEAPVMTESELWNLEAPVMTESELWNHFLIAISTIEWAANLIGRALNTIEDPIVEPFFDLCSASLPVKVTPKPPVRRPSSKNHQCNICGRAFTRRWNMVCHQRRHFPENRKHKCPACTKMFFTTEEIERHARTHDTRSSRTLVCPAGCLQTFTRKDSLLRHVKNGC
jgi:hypothetical protein